ncbi:MAG TPA: tetratricopeptide repeat protein [Pyrinomonadaceae bacterium]|nr:tetratricopeptide repeat protein [Pyrinomonadaceae bacterium]
MSEVFISYRQTNDDQKQRVRTFAERLRDAGIDVIFDQFFRDKKAGGPNEGWPKWSSDNALNTEFVLVIGSQGWFECFEGTQKSGTGMGAACEAADIRTRLYDAAGVIENIRVVLFDDADQIRIPGRLRPYHHFHAGRDFEDIVRWLGGALIVITPQTSIPHNLPSLQPFFGREYELRKIAEALHPERRTWGALVDGPGGMGKTSLAVRAAYDASQDAFDRIAFVSLKSRELDDDGVRDLSGFLVSGLAELLNELARELGHAQIAKVPEDQRARRLLDTLRGTRTLLILDNLESLLKTERDTVFTFVNRLPPGCKAILTSRGRIGSGAEELILEKLSEEAALATLESLAESNPALANTSGSERLKLYTETAGKPLLLRWTAGQIGRGNCVTFTDAIEYLRSCPEDNDPLEFIFGDLVEDFTESETSLLCALTYFTLPAKVEHLVEVSECSQSDANRALRSLVNRSLVVPSEEFKTFALVPLVADFLRKKKPEVVIETGDQLENRAYGLVVENGYEKYDRFPVLDAAWPTVAAAMSRFISGNNERLQTICVALDDFLHFTGRWDEWLALSRDREVRALAVKDFLNAGWGAYKAGFIHVMRGQSSEVFVCADRAESHWRDAQADVGEGALAIQLRGMGHRLTKNYGAAITAYCIALNLFTATGRETENVIVVLLNLANAKRLSGDLDSAERDYQEALQIARAIDSLQCVTASTGSLARLELSRGEWLCAEAFAVEALSLSEKLGRIDFVGVNSYFLAAALVGQGRKIEAFPHAQRAVEIFTALDDADLDEACKILWECEI